MDGNQLRRLKPELENFLERYAGLFGRAENHEHARQLVQGLLDGSDRRNVENMAEAVEGGVVRTLQKFVSQGCWEDRAILGELRAQVVAYQNHVKIAEAETATGSAPRPGVGVSLGTGAIAGSIGTAAISGGATTAAGEMFMSTIEADSTHTANELATRIATAYRNRGWLPPQ